MSEQEILYSFYQELADEGKWQTKNYQMSLHKGMLMIGNKKTKKEIVLDLRIEKK